MKYSLSSRQTPEYLVKADEITVRYRDRNIIYDLIEKYPTAGINLTRFYQESEKDEIDWEEIEAFNTLAQGRFVLGLTSPDEVTTARIKGLKFYYLAGARSFAELRDYMAQGVCAIKIAAPLFFQMDKVKQVCSLPIRAVANIANLDALFTRADGVVGTWIRPEDVELYEPYIETIEFIGNQSQEQALYRIYAEQHAWSGELGMLIPDLNYPCTNRMVPPDLAKARLNCGQRCMENSRCRLCYRYFDLADADKLRNYLESMEQT